MRAETHSARGEPAALAGEARLLNSLRVISWLSVRSSGKSVRLSCLVNDSGYTGNADRSVIFNGGIVDDGLGAVRANTRAEAVASAKALNSAVGVT